MNNLNHSKILAARPRAGCFPAMTDPRPVGRRLEAGFGEKWLCSITRIYTQLHAFTQSSWALTLRTQTKRKSPQKGNGDWPQKNAENAKRVGNGMREAVVVH